jgi:polygalacturonase
MFSVLLAAACATPAEYNVKDFGAKGNGKSDNTEAINRAIAHCNEQGGGVVVVPAGRYLSGTIHLKSNVELRLEKDAVLLGIADPKQYTGYVCRREGFEKTPKQSIKRYMYS